MKISASILTVRWRQLFRGSICVYSILVVLNIHCSDKKSFESQIKNFPIILSLLNQRNCISYPKKYLVTEQSLVNGRSDWETINYVTRECIFTREFIYHCTIGRDLLAKYFFQNSDKFSQKITSLVGPINNLVRKETLQFQEIYTHNENGLLIEYSRIDESYGEKYFTWDEKGRVLGGIITKGNCQNTNIIWTYNENQNIISYRAISENIDCNNYTVYSYDEKYILRNRTVKTHYQSQNYSYSNYEFANLCQNN